MIKGLNKDQVEQSRKLHGDNIIHEAEQETFWDKFKGAFDDPMIKLLLVIAAIMAIMAVMGYAVWRNYWYSNFCVTCYWNFGKN